ncbi:hypothetical protein T492DRAFT_872119, partial [Pavlovales sp. CCMP2436]
VELDDEVRAINALSSLSARARAKLELLLRPELRVRTRVRVRALAPLVVLPADVGSAEADWLGLEMDLIEASTVDELAAACGSGADGSAYRSLLESEVPTAFVDYALAEPGDGVVSGTGGGARGRECIVCPFGAQAYLETCVISADHTLPRTRARVAVHRLDVELSLGALSRLAALAAAVGASLEADGQHAAAARTEHESG